MHTYIYRGIIHQSGARNLVSFRKGAPNNETVTRAHQRAKANIVKFIKVRGDRGRP